MVGNGFLKPIGLGVKMKVIDLIAELSALDENAIVVLASDEEGNSYHLCDSPAYDYVDDEPYVFLFPTGYSLDI
jgi:hypothetical protein